MSDIQNVVEQAVESFSVDDFIAEAAAPEDQVTVYLDAKTAYEIERLKEQHDSVVREQAAARENKQAQSIAEAADHSDLLENIDLQLAELKERIKSSAMSFHFRAVGEVERDLLARQVARQLPTPKNASQTEAAIRQQEREDATLYEWLSKATVKIVRERDGAVQIGASAGTFSNLHANLYHTEWEKIVALFNRLSFADALFERAVDAGFPGRGTVEA